MLEEKQVSLTEPLLIEGSESIINKLNKQEPKPDKYDLIIQGCIEPEYEPSPFDNFVPEPFDNIKNIIQLKKDSVCGSHFSKRL